MAIIAFRLSRPAKTEEEKGWKENFKRFNILFLIIW